MDGEEGGWLGEQPHLLGVVGPAAADPHLPPLPQRHENKWDENKCVVVVVWASFPKALTTTNLISGEPKLSHKYHP